MTIFLEKFPASKLEPRLASLPPIPPGEPRFVYCAYRPSKSGWKLAIYNATPQTYAEALELKRAYDDGGQNYKRTILRVDETK